MTFADTKYLCINEIGRYNDNRFKLTYYKYPLEKDAKPAHQNEFKEGEWSYEYIVKQTNTITQSLPGLRPDTITNGTLKLMI